MNNVITYIRVSTDEQANTGFSLRDQQAKLNTHCESRGYKVLERFSEDFSAKTFDRPTFKILVDFIKKNKGVVSKLVFLKWDRFSRNATEALIMIKELTRLGVECEAIEQPLDLSVPENKLLLVIYLSTPEIENDRRSLNTSSGIRRALKEGRYCNVAPFGYKYSRDERNKPILVPDGYKAELIKESFELYCSGISKQEVRRILAPKGIKLSRSRFSAMFDNVLYSGKILIPAHGDEPEAIIEGAHQAIISEELFQKTQILSSKSKAIQSKPKSTKVELPLRGFLVCPKCGNNLTGSGSRSQTGKRFYYYHCQNGCRHRENAEYLNLKFAEFLDEITLKPKHKKVYLSSFERICQMNKVDKKKELEIIQDKLTKTEQALLKTDKLLVEGVLEFDSYQRLKDTYKEEINTLKVKQYEFNETGSIEIDHMEFAFKIFGNLRKLWDSSCIDGKRIFISSIFPEKLIFQNNEYRTLGENTILNQFFQIFNDLDGNKKEKVINFDDLSRSVARTGIEPVFPE
jgi:site-specific DNA recombinase